MFLNIVRIYTTMLSYSCNFLCCNSAKLIGFALIILSRFNDARFPVTRYPVFRPWISHIIYFRLTNFSFSHVSLRSYDLTINIHRDFGFEWKTSIFSAKMIVFQFLIWRMSFWQSFNNESLKIGFFQHINFLFLSFFVIVWTFIKKSVNSLLLFCFLLIKKLFEIL